MTNSGAELQHLRSPSSAVLALIHLAPASCVWRGRNRHSRCYHSYPSDEYEEATCGEFNNLVLFLIDPEACSSYTNIAPFCCDNGGSGGCAICRDGSPIGNIETLIYAEGKPFTCADGAQRLLFGPLHKGNPGYAACLNVNHVVRDEIS
jgi:hypothetical protein